MTDLAHYLGSIDPRLVSYLDEDGTLSVDTIRKVHRYAVVLLQEHVVPEHVHEDWPDFFLLAAAIVYASGSQRLGLLAQKSSIFKGWGDDPLTERDRAFLVALLNASYERLGSR
jgi:hypothetical protein